MHNILLSVCINNEKEYFLYLPHLREEGTDVLVKSETIRL